jgi:hypothetical protein
LEQNQLLCLPELVVELYKSRCWADLGKCRSRNSRRWSS